MSYHSSSNGQYNPSTDSGQMSAASQPTPPTRSPTNVVFAQSDGLSFSPLALCRAQALALIPPGGSRGAQNLRVDASQANYDVTMEDKHVPSSAEPQYFASGAYSNASTIRSTPRFIDSSLD
ncbi:hypothetical protein CYLTODRAFT_409034 [Cylindrobasidium torrendii FP15055 ss-10]|uniref:Uncharacterized protein n=1 Tax=Cylindrobasidium torrendii FP15055 ss-10 TaxID=1314674 RepID=A0A0D7BJE5_9AGAR|nr:hypothetical protein CYLTODRAFT_409034 [Cylindrobasidium torrendii FP15055 ss-10]